MAAAAGDGCCDAVFGASALAVAGGAVSVIDVEVLLGRLDAAALAGPGDLATTTG